MAASAGTNPGSTPDGVGVGDGDSLGEGIADGVAEGEAVGVSDEAGLIAAVGVHPPIRMATATTGKPRLMRRSEVPTACLYDEAGPLRHAPRTPRENLLSYAHGIFQTLSPETLVPFYLTSVTFFPVRR